MVRSIGAQLGILTFAVAIIAGLQAGNPVTVILTRALIAMVVGATLGQAVGWAVKQVLRDHLQRKKLAIDKHHIAASKAMLGPDAELDVVEASTPEQAE